MSIGAKITKVLGNNKYEIEVEPVDTNSHTVTFGVAHDYVLFSTWTHLNTDYDSNVMIDDGGIRTNILPIKATIQIPIKMMGQVILPELNASGSLDPEHFNDYVVTKNTKVQMWSNGDFLWIYNSETRNFEKITRTLYNTIKGITK